MPIAGGMSPVAVAHRLGRKDANETLSTYSRLWHDDDTRAAPPTDRVITLCSAVLAPVSPERALPQVRSRRGRYPAYRSTHPTTDPLGGSAARAGPRSRPGDNPRLSRRVRRCSGAVVGLILEHRRGSRTQARR